MSPEKAGRRQEDATMIARALRVATIARIAVPFALAIACSKATRSPHAADIDRSVITEEQIVSQHYQNLFDAVQALRSNWLQTRGTDSFINPSQVWVYLDNVRYGGVQTLSSLSPQGVISISHYNGIDATARWGIGHSAGVIYVATWPTGAPPDTVTQGVTTTVTEDSTTAKPHP
jgi:hypothetical protein